MRALYTPETIAASSLSLAPDWRVRPLDELQWVLERRNKARPGDLKVFAGAWRPWAYCTTRLGLETALSRLKTEGVALDPTPLASLPAQFPTPPDRLADEGVADVSRGKLVPERAQTKKLVGRRGVAVRFRVRKSLAAP
jgi:hypothetical protein